MHKMQSAENSAQRWVPTYTSQSEMLVCMPTVVSMGWVLRLRLWRSGPRERTGVDFPEGGSLSGLAWHSGGTPEKKLGTAREARDHCCEDPLTLCDHRWQDTTYTSVQVGWPTPATPEAGPPVVAKAAWVREVGDKMHLPRGGHNGWHSCYQAATKHRSLSMLSWEPMHHGCANGPMTQDQPWENIWPSSG